MSKKNYQINVINAESIKKQNDEENKGAQQSQTNVQNKPQEFKTGLMIGGLISFFLALCFIGSTVYFIYQTYNSVDNAQQAVTFIVFILSVGWISYIPGVLCSIISLCLNPFVIKSSSKGQKAVGIIFTILSVLMILAFMAIAFYISALPNS